MDLPDLDAFASAMQSEAAAEAMERELVHMPPSLPVRSDAPYAGHHSYGPNTVLAVSADSTLESRKRGPRPSLGIPTTVRVR